MIIGVTEQGRWELVAFEDGFRESAASWETLLTGLRERGLFLTVRAGWPEDQADPVGEGQRLGIVIL